MRDLLEAYFKEKWLKKLDMIILNIDNELFWIAINVLHLLKCNCAIFLPSFILIKNVEKLYSMLMCNLEIMYYDKNNGFQL